MRKQGTLVVAGRARALPLHASGGRPAPFRHGYMEIWNRYEIHRRDRGYRSVGDRIRFAYAWTLDTLLLTRHLLVPFRTAAILKRLAGRITAACRILFHRNAGGSHDGTVTAQRARGMSS